MSRDPYMFSATKQACLVVSPRKVSSPLTRGVSSYTPSSLPRPASTSPRWTVSPYPPQRRRSSHSHIAHSWRSADPIPGVAWANSLVGWQNAPESRHFDQKRLQIFSTDSWWRSLDREAAPSLGSRHHKVLQEKRGCAHSARNYFVLLQNLGTTSSRFHWADPWRSSRGWTPYIHMHVSCINSTARLLVTRTAETDGYERVS